MLSFSICYFPESIVVDFIENKCQFTTLPDYSFEHKRDSLRLDIMKGGHGPEIGYFFHPKINPDLLLFTSNLRDGWHSLLWSICVNYPDAAYVQIRYDSEESFISEFKYFKNPHTWRVVRVMDDYDRLEWFAHGSYLPFENLEYYKKRRKKDRLTFEVLEEYVQKLGLPSLGDEIFYPAGEYLKLSVSYRS